VFSRSSEVWKNVVPAFRFRELRREELSYLAVGVLERSEHRPLRFLLLNRRAPQPSPQLPAANAITSS
jgi:hypothetical protein